MIDPGRVVLTIFGFQAMLGLLVHSIVLGADPNWPDDGSAPISSPSEMLSELDPKNQSERLAR
ncbi:light-harvesting protein [Thiorhodovibrio frisius]